MGKENKELREIQNIMFGNRLKEYRNKSGFTQEEFAEMLNITQPSLVRYEKGKVMPRDDVIDKMAELLNVHPDLLKYSQDPFYSYSENEERITIKVETPTNKDCLYATPQQCLDFLEYNVASLTDEQKFLLVQIVRAIKLSNESYIWKKNIYKNPTKRQLGYFNVDPKASASIFPIIVDGNLEVKDEIKLKGKKK